MRLRRLGLRTRSSSSGCRCVGCEVEVCGPLEVAPARPEVAQDPLLQRQLPSLLHGIGEFAEALQPA